MSLLSRRPRMGCVVGAIVLAPIVAFGVATLFELWDPPASVPEPLAQRAFAREVGASHAIGLVLGSEGNEALHGGATQRTIPVVLQEGECLGVTAAAWGFFSVRRVAIVDEAAVQLAVGEQQSALARSVQWCAPRAQTLSARIELANADTVLGRDAYADGHVRWEIDRGRPAAGLASLVRGRPTEVGSQRVPREVFIASADAMLDGRAPLGPAIEVAAHRARLVPESAASYARMHTLAVNGSGDAVTPRWDPLPISVPAPWRPLATGAEPSAPRLVSGGAQTARDGAHPAIAFREGTGYRLLAVVQPRALGGCVNVQLVRLLWGYGTAAERLDRRSVRRERNMMLDRACDAGTVEYIAPGNDYATYLLRFFPG